MCVCMLQFRSRVHQKKNSACNNKQGTLARMRTSAHILSKYARGRSPHRRVPPPPLRCVPRAHGSPCMCVCVCVPARRMQLHSRETIRRNPKRFDGMHVICPPAIGCCHYCRTLALACGPNRREGVRCRGRGALRERPIGDHIDRGPNKSARRQSAERDDLHLSSRHLLFVCFFFGGKLATV